jgi:hypothetical protein
MMQTLKVGVSSTRSWPLPISLEGVFGGQKVYVQTESGWLCPHLQAGVAEKLKRYV